MFYTTWKPATDLFSAESSWLIKMELAGVLPVDISIVPQRNVLHVRGRRRDLHLHQDFVCHSLEISYTNFERSIPLPSLIDANSIRCEFRDGILQIFLETL